MTRRGRHLTAGTAAVTALALAACAAPGAASAASGWTDYTRPATYQTTEDKNVAIEMRDGVKLSAGIVRPDDTAPHPVIVVQTPYNRSGGIGAFLGGSTDFFAERGYVVVTVDVRGTGSSGGTWDSFGEDEQKDGPEVVEWAAKQPWSDGHVGLWGPSYMGLNQLLTAAQRPPHLDAIFPIVPMADGYRDITFTGGQVNVGLHPVMARAGCRRRTDAAPGTRTPPTRSPRSRRT